MNNILSFKLNKYLITIIQKYNINVKEQKYFEELNKKIWWIKEDLIFCEKYNINNYKITHYRIVELNGTQHNNGYWYIGQK